MSSGVLPFHMPARFALKIISRISGANAWKPLSHSGVGWASVIVEAIVIRSGSESGKWRCAPRRTLVVASGSNREILRLNREQLDQTHRSSLPVLTLRLLPQAIHSEMAGGLRLSLSPSLLFTSVWPKLQPSSVRKQD